MTLSSPDDVAACGAEPAVGTVAKLSVTAPSAISNAGFAVMRISGRPGTGLAIASTRTPSRRHLYIAARVRVERSSSTRSPRASTGSPSGNRRKGRSSPCMKRISPDSATTTLGGIIARISALRAARPTVSACAARAGCACTADSASGGVSKTLRGRADERIGEMTRDGPTFRNRRHFFESVAKSERCVPSDSEEPRKATPSGRSAKCRLRSTCSCTACRR